MGGLLCRWISCDPVGTERNSQTHPPCPHPALLPTAHTLLLPTAPARQTIPCDNTFGKFFAYTLHEPIGVVGQIIPWSE